jgi:hypothetical protein
MGVDTCHDTLPCRFLVACGAVDLSGKEKVPDKFGLEGMEKLCRVEEIVLDGISRAV